MQKLHDYFTQGLDKRSASDRVGMEVETSFVDGKKPASIRQSQQIFQTLLGDGWKIENRKGELVTTIIDTFGNRMLYELGRQNIEVSTIPATALTVIDACRATLERLYFAARHGGLEPYFGPILPTREDLLVIPDERDATWLGLDGRKALRPLARISAVQFTLDVTPELVVPYLNALGAHVDVFLADYPQDRIWKQYIEASEAGYHPLRYGGPLHFKSLEDYCFQLSKHAVVQGTHLVPYKKAQELNIPLYIRSIWWYFRLRRYGTSLCIEVRPIPRRGDSQLEGQLRKVLQTITPDPVHF